MVLSAKDAEGATVASAGIIRRQSDLILFAPQVLIWTEVGVIDT